MEIDNAPKSATHATKASKSGMRFMGCLRDEDLKWILEKRPDASLKTYQSKVSANNDASHKVQTGGLRR